MIIQIENKDYLLISTDKDTIQLDLNNQELPILYAPAGLSIQELSAYVKQFGQSKRTKSLAEEEFLEFFTLNIFGKNYSVKPLKTGQSKPYLKNEIIYYSKSVFNSKSKDKLETQIAQYIFEQTILDLIGKWEDLLGILIQEISFKKLPKNFYRLTDGNLTFSKSNIHFDLKVNEYILAKALIELAMKNNKFSVKLEDQFPDFRQIEKILAYGN